MQKKLGRGASYSDYEGVTYLPLRLVSETLGAQVHWSAEEQKIRIVQP